MDFDVNVIAIIVAVAASMIVGYVWYLPGIFGSIFMDGLGLSDEDKKKPQSKGEMTRGLVIEIIATLTMAFVLAIFIATLNVKLLPEAMLVAFLLWAGFSAPALSTSTSWERKTFYFFFNNAMFRLVSVLLMSIIIFLIS